MPNYLLTFEDGSFTLARIEDHCRDLFSSSFTLYLISCLSCNFWRFKFVESHLWIKETGQQGKRWRIKDISCSYILAENEGEDHSVMSDSLRPHGSYSLWNSPGQNTGVGSHSILQGIFPTQGLNLGLLHCRWILYQLSHKGSPRILEWIAYPFSSGSSWPRNWTRISCIAGGFFTNWAMREVDILAAAAAKSLQSCPVTLCDPIDGSPPGSPIPRILQARPLEQVAISFSNAWKWKVKVKSLSHVWLLVTPWTAAHQAPLSKGFSRQEDWSGVPLPSLDILVRQHQLIYFLNWTKKLLLQLFQIM